MDRRAYAVLWTVAAALLLGALYFGLRGSLGGREASSTNSRTFRLTISTPRPGTELPVFKVTQGDTVTFVVGSDGPGEAHVHGYDKRIALNPGSEVTLTFIAKDAGLYPLHLHERLDFRDPDSPVLHRHLAVIEVQPK